MMWLQTASFAGRRSSHRCRPAFRRFFVHHRQSQQRKITLAALYEAVFLSRLFFLIGEPE